MILARCQDLQKTAGRATGFAQMLTGRHRDRLNGWIATVDLSELRRFIRGLLPDHDAVLDGLTLTHSSGQVEGAVNRTKMIKRQNVRASELRPAPQTSSPHDLTAPGPTSIAE